ncbi:tRNA uridine-5-carboxymethylaminomethyl(34) synthesis GTPase MnmE [candidate division KSB1 bacterium]|nr:tRNA uridine-5-carboxymethylaminomethyl(34) synthesis GTPase MnmE [candidate division KSB1 bacterium]
MTHPADTIAAIATPIGLGGIGIVRMSGTSSFDILASVFMQDKENALEGWRMYHGTIMDAGEQIDEVLVAVFRSPHSYTREDMVEINCHGGLYVMRRILNVLLKYGARMAQPGEFTRRAFLNGRIDLSQAEAVAEVIYANTGRSLEVSMQHLQGRLRDLIETLRTKLIRVCSLLEVELDFAEEDIQFAERTELADLLNDVESQLSRLLNSYRRGKLLRHGVKLVIVGKPNVGKSSLLNALLQEDRAIVTDIPGTTRDSLEEQLEIHGILFRVVDTAGINITDDVIERHGISRTYQHIKSADLVLHVFDGTNDVSDHEVELSQQLIEGYHRGEVSPVAIINKADLTLHTHAEQLLYEQYQLPILYISAKEGSGIDQLEQCLYERVMDDRGASASYADAIILTQERHARATEEAITHINEARSALNQSKSSEFIAFDVRNALNSLGEIVGVVTTHDILNTIFNNFCIGK